MRPPKELDRSKTVRILERIAVASVVVYLCLVAADALYFAYTGILYSLRPGLTLEQRRSQSDVAKKQEFLRKHPTYSGVVGADGSGQIPKLARKYTFLPLAPGLPHTPLIGCNEGYGFLTYTADRYGFHNDDAVWDVEHPWLLIGDSFAHGDCVPTRYNIASRVRGLSGNSVINLATPGNGPDRYVALARTFIGLTRARKVIVAFYENDFDAPSGSVYASQTTAFTPYLNGNFREATERFYKEVREFIDSERNRFITGERGWRSRVRKVRRKIVDAVARVFTLTDIRNVLFHNVETFNYVRLAVETAVEECDKFKPGCDVVVVYIPPSDFYRPRPQAFVDAQAAYLRRVVEGIKKRIRFIDLRGRLDRSSYAPEGLHLSIQGYQLVAERIVGTAQ